jgi:hypothetical protein
VSTTAILSTRRPSSPTLRRLRPTWILAFTVILLSGRARGADPPADDEPMFAPSIELRDVAPHELYEAHGKSGAPLWLSITAGAALLKGGERSFEAALLLSVPLDRIANRRSARSTAPGSAPTLAEEAAPTLKPPPRRPKSTPEERARAPENQGDVGDASPTQGSQAPTREAQAPPPSPPPLLITPVVARAAARAALKHARLADATARVDALVARARTSALLPELRLRASRLVDEDQQLSPTEYDPARITASGGTSVWLEARATWRLDRLLFSDEEVALERMRNDRSEAQAKLVEKVIELLFTWQRAITSEAIFEEQGATEEHITAALKVAEAEASLDVLTDGWFTRWLRSARSRPRQAIK